MLANAQQTTLNSNPRSVESCCQQSNIQDAIGLMRDILKKKGLEVRGYRTLVDRENTFYLWRCYKGNKCYRFLFIENNKLNGPLAITTSERKALGKQLRRSIIARQKAAKRSENVASV